MFDVQSLKNTIRIRYWFALLFVVFFIIFALIILNQQISLQIKHVETVNMAGQQRMLSQKIALYATKYIQQLEQGDVDSRTQSKLVNAALKMQENQRQLSGVDEIEGSISHLYFGEQQLNSRVELLTNKAINLTQQDYSALNLTVDNQFFNGEFADLLLNDLDLAVNLFEQNILDKAEELKRIELLLLVAIMGVLIAVTVYFLKPILHKVKQTYEQLKIEQNKVADYQLAIDQHSLFIEFDVKRVITAVNDLFVDMHGYTREELVGQHISFLFAELQDSPEFKDIYHTIEAGDVWRGNFVNKAKSGHSFWFKTTVVPLKNQHEHIESFIVLQNDITEQVSTEKALREVHAITANSSLPFNDKIHQLLNQGKKIYQLPLAIVSEITGEQYKVLYSDTPNDEVKPNDTFELGRTYCYHTVKANRPVAYHHAAESDIKGHPCYREFGLESYIGAPICVGTRRFGTLNFSSPDKSPYPFKETDLELIQLMAQWIGFELERHEQQKSLVSQQQLMTQMSQLARIGAWEVDLRTNTITWSEMTKIIHEVEPDYQPDLATAINFYKEGESRDKITKLVEAAINKGSAYNVELELVTAKGHDIWVAAKGESIFEDGVCVKLFGSFQDITKQKQVDLELQNKSRRMSVATDSAGIGVWEWDIVNDELKWDAWMYRLFGIEASDYSNNSEAWRQGVHPDDIEQYLTKLDRAIEQGDKLDAEYRIVWPDGTIKHIKAAAIVLYNDNSKPIRLTGVNYDITERVENEQALTEAKLQAEAGSRAKNEFLASMSHEIRTPMNGVIGMLELLKDTPLNSEQHHKVDIAQSSASSLLQLINDILDFSKIDADKLDLEMIDFDLCAMLGELAESFELQTEAKRIALIIDTTAIKYPMINGDPSRIRQVLTNLLSNSIKFTLEGEVNVVASLEVDQKQRDYWQLHIDVKDTGIGIAPEKHQHLFDNFSQVDASTTREYGGTGLGLAIVKKLCTRMQGTISVQSELGKGSCFSCTLRVGVVKEKVAIAQENDLTDRTVLIFDSNVTNANMVARHFENKNASVFVAHNRAKAWLICQQQLKVNNQELTEVAYTPFDLIIVDQLVGSNDIDSFISMLSKTSGLAETHLMAMTAMSGKVSQTIRQYSHFIGQFPKPATSADLIFAEQCALGIKQAPKDLMVLSEVEHLDNSFTISSDINEEPCQQSDTSSNDLDSYWPAHSKILLVEDNRVNQMVAKGVLNKLGLDCDIAVNGRDALDKLIVTQDYALILMDVQMPELDGYQATEKIRRGEASDHYKDIKIVAMTANAMQGDREKCLQAGMNDYLAKPINKEAILKTLSFWLGVEQNLDA